MRIRKDDYLASSPILSLEPEELRRLLDDEPMSSQPIDNSAALQDSTDAGDQLSIESLDTAELLEMLASPGRSPANDVNQPGPAARVRLPAPAPQWIAISTSSAAAMFPIIHHEAFAAIDD
ncbi:hypothetical protein ACFIOY_18045 [Bradyrhizobium sp. TZ2]